MAVDWAGGYASPSIRKLVFDQLHPGALVEFEVIPMEEAFPNGFNVDKEFEAEMAVLCTLILDDGTFYTGPREIPTRYQDSRSKEWKPVPPSPELFVKCSTQAMGRALTTAGIPQKRAEIEFILKLLFPKPDFGSGPRRTDRSTGEITQGEPAELTMDQVVTAAFNRLSGPQKAAVSEKARAAKITNVLRPGERAEEVLDMIRPLLGEED